MRILRCILHIYVCSLLLARCVQRKPFRCIRMNAPQAFPLHQLNIGRNPQEIAKTLRLEGYLAALPPLRIFPKYSILFLGNL